MANGMGDFKLAEAYVQFSARDTDAVAQGAAKVKEELEGVQGAAEEAGESLSGMSTILGVGIGGAGLLAAGALIGSFRQLRDEGLSFSDALDGTLQHLFGIQTEAEQALKAQEKITEAVKEQAKAENAVADAIKRAKKEKEEFQNIAGGGAALQASSDAANKALQQAGIGRNAIRHQEEGLAEAIKNGAPDDLIQQWRDDLEKAHKRWDGIIAAAEGAEQTLQQEKRLLEEANKQLEKEKKDKEDRAANEKQEREDGAAADREYRELERRRLEDERKEKKAEEDLMKEQREAVLNRMKEQEERHRKEEKAAKEAEREQEKRQREIDKIRDLDPRARFRDQVKEIEALRGKGLGNAEADRAEEALIRRAAAEKSEPPRFQGIEEFLRGIQESPTEKEQLLTQKEMRDILKDIKLQNKVGVFK